MITNIRCYKPMIEMIFNTRINSINSYKIEKRDDIEYHIRCRAYYYKDIIHGWKWSLRYLCSMYVYVCRWLLSVCCSYVLELELIIY